MWPEIQRHIAAALVDPEAPVPEGITARSPAVVAVRFDVYRNNVMVGLLDALEATFPVVSSLVGNDFFRAVARHHARRSLPRSPVLLDYGADFPDTLADYEPAGQLPYLADVARLEWAWNRAYHAADAIPIPLARLATVEAGGLDNLQCRLHPSLALLESPWPIISIWQAHQTNSPRDALARLRWEGERALVLRPAMQVTVRAVSSGTFSFASALAAGRPLGVALAELDDEEEQSAALAGLFEAGGIVGIE